MDKKEEWINDVFNSTQGMQRSQAPIDLFDKIEARIDQKDAKIIPIQQWRAAAVAAVVLIAVNLFALQQYSQNNTSGLSIESNEYADSQSFTSSYQLYE